MNSLLSKHSGKILLALILCGTILRVCNLNWGAPFYFHPDERNIASGITQLAFPHDLNPHFFAYGGLPIYLTYFSGVEQNVIQAALGREFTTKLTFENAILILRLFSALLSIVTIPLTFVIGKKLQDKPTGLLAATLTTFSIGLIQFAHFGTFEMWLTFFSLLLFYCILLSKDKLTLPSVLKLGVCLGVLISTKVTSLMLIPLTLVPLVTSRPHSLRKRLVALVCLAITVTCLYLLTNPFSLLDYTSFSGSMSYESQVALGTMHVFYTGEFLRYIPVMFPLIHVYPFLLNPLFTCLFPLSFIGVLFLAWKKRSLPLFLLCSFTLVLFFSQVVLFVQWTRYYVPTLPFIYLLIAICLMQLLSTLKRRGITTYHPAKVFIGASVTISIVFALAFVKTVYLSVDTRVEAAKFATEHIPQDAHILSEVYDLGIVPFNDHFHSITLFNFYDLDNNSPEFNNQTLQSTLEQTEAIILPSQRLLKVRSQNAKDFPNGHRFYTDLLQGRNGFRKIYQTPCDVWCQLTYFGDPVFAYEQTANIFDRPTISIFTKQ